MNYNEIIAIHKFFLKQYSLSSRLVQLKQEAFAANYHINNSVESFIEKLVDSGKELQLAYLQKTLPLTYLQQELVDENITVIAFLRNELLYTPVFLKNESDLLKLQHIDESGNLFKEKWSPSFSENILRDSNGEVIFVVCFPFEKHEESKSTYSKQEPTVHSVLSRFYKLLLTEKKEIGHLYIYAFLSGFLSLSLPLGIQSIINFVSSGQISTSVVVLISLIILGILASGGLSIMQLYLVEYIQKRVFAKTAFDFTFRIPKLKLEAILNVYPPELMNRFFDVLTLQKGIAKILIDFSAAILQIIFGLILLSFYHPSFILLGALVVVTIVLVIRFTSSKSVKTSLNESKYKYMLAHWLQEMSRAISTFKLVGHTNLTMNKTDSLVSSYLFARRQHFKVLVIQYTAFTVFKTLITAGLLILGSYLLINQEINLGQFVASEIVIILIMNACEKVILQLDTFYDVLTSTEKLGAISDLPLENHTGTISLPLNEKVGLSIKVKNLYYRYASNSYDTLNNISIDIQSSEKVCFMGYRSSGKKTFFNLMLGVFQDYKGVIAFDGLSFRDVTRNSLISLTGDNISQKDIFDGTLLENITLGRSNISIEDIRFAVEKVGLSEYVFSLPNGFNEKITKGLKNLSSVLIHKIILARSIVHKPRLLILDDVFSRYRKDEKNKIIDFIFDPHHTWTVIMLSEDPEIMERCDKIVLMKEGTIVYDGKYDPLQIEANLDEII